MVCMHVSSLPAGGGRRGGSRPGPDTLAFIGRGPKKEILHHREKFLTVGGVSLALATVKTS